MPADDPGALSSGDQFALIRASLARIEDKLDQKADLYEVRKQGERIDRLEADRDSRRGVTNATKWLIATGIAAGGLLAMIPSFFFYLGVGR